MNKIASLAAIFACTSVIASEPTYNYIEAGYADYYDADGLLIRGKYAYDKNIFFAGAFESVDDRGAEVDKLLAGVGYRMPLKGNTSVYGQASLVNWDSFSIEEDGFQLGIGYRNQFKHESEFYGELNHINLDNITLTEFVVGLRHKLTHDLGAYFEVRMDDFDNDGFSLGITYKY